MNRQLDDKALEYKYGFKKLYNWAKLINFIIIFISFIISAISVVIKLLNNKYESQIVFATFIWGIISTYLNNYKNSIKKKAADLQEFYDIYVFGLEKNKYIMYPIEDTYTIINYVKLEKEEYYNIGESILDDNFIIKHQKKTILYDRKMREIYYKFNKFRIFMYIIVLIILSIWMKLDFYNLSLVIIIPSINIFNYFNRISNGLSSEIEKINNMKVEMDGKNLTYDKYTIRCYQDFIYMKRREWTMIPNYIYKIYNYINSYLLKLNDI